MKLELFKDINSKKHIKNKNLKKNIFIHKSAIIDKNVRIGKDSKIWHFTHILENARIGKNCIISQGCMVAQGVKISKNVKIQNNVSIFSGVRIKKNVFIAPSVCFTNVLRPRSFINQKDNFKKTIVKKGATIGANSTIICGIYIGKYAFIGAGSVVTKDVPSFALVAGNPAKIIGFVDKNGNRIS